MADVVYLYICRELCPAWVICDGQCLSDPRLSLQITFDMRTPDRLKGGASQLSLVLSLLLQLITTLILWLSCICSRFVYPEHSSEPGLWSLYPVYSKLDLLGCYSKCLYLEVPCHHARLICWDNAINTWMYIVPTLTFYCTVYVSIVWHKLDVHKYLIYGICHCAILSGI